MSEFAEHNRPTWLSRIGELRVLLKRVNAVDAARVTLAILSPDGEVLTDSRLDGRNIGFPIREEDREHFRNMFQTTATRIRDAEIESMIAGTKGE